MEVLNFRVHNFSILKTDFYYTKGIILNLVTFLRL